MNTLHKLLELHVDHVYGEKFVIYGENKISKMKSCSNTRLIYENNLSSYQLMWCGFSALRKLYCFLNDALYVKEHMVNNFEQNLGYLFNLYGAYNNFHKQHADLILEKNKDGYATWPGYAYLLYGVNYQQPIFVDSWLYFNEKKEIIFEITPEFLYFDSDINDMMYEFFLAWLEFYKPCVVKKMNVILIEQWLKQLDVLIKKVSSQNKSLPCSVNAWCEMCTWEESE